MSVGLVIVCHGSIGAAMVEAAEFILDESLKRIAVISLDQSGIQVPESAALTATMNASDNGSGVLILTDLQGATPCNLIAGAAKRQNGTPSADGTVAPVSVVVSGLNLAMLIRVWNYRDRPLEELRDLAIAGGQRGIGTAL